MYGTAISSSLVGCCPFGRMCVSKLMGFGVHRMPVDLPPVKKPSPSVAASPNPVLERSLNWLALLIGIGLCLWALKYGLSTPI